MPVKAPQQSLSVNLIFAVEGRELICKIIFMVILKNIEYQFLFINLLYLA